MNEPEGLQIKAIPKMVQCLKEAQKSFEPPRNDIESMCETV